METSPLRLLLVAALSACLIIGIARDAQASATASLTERLSEVVHMRGDFMQTQYGPNGEVLGESAGRFQLLRPAFFSWEIPSPDSQLIVADDIYLWHYDKDLETLTRRPVTAVAVSPLQVLGGDLAALSDRFDIEGEGDSYTLRALDADAGFESLSLRFEGNSLVAMEVLDRLQQRIVVMFSAVDLQTLLSADDFAINAPENVDTFYYEE